MANKVGIVEGTIVGKVVSGSITQKTSNGGRDYEQSSIGIKMPNGCTVFVRNNLNLEAESQYIVRESQKIMDIVNNYKDEDIYVQLRLKADKKTGENSFAKFSTYLRADNNNLGFSAEGFFDVLKHTTDEEGNVVLIMNGMKGEYQKPLSSANTNMTISGYVEQVENNLITVVSSDKDYPMTWHITCPEEMDKKYNILKQLVVGQMYAFECKFVKGEKIKEEENLDENPFDFSSDFTIESMSNKNRFDSDKLMMIKGGLIKGNKIELKASNKKTKSSVVDSDEEFPF